MVDALRLRVWDEHETEVPLQAAATNGDCTFSVRSLPGASGVHVAVVDATGAVRLRAEVEADPGDVVTLQFDLDEEGAPHVRSRGRKVILLPPDARYDPPRPITRTSAGAPLEVAIVVDATLRSWSDATPRLLDCREVWAAHADALTAFVERLATDRPWRCAVIAFGDQQPPEVNAEDLRPRYHLHPIEQDRTLRPCDPGRLREALLEIPSSPGADYADALADALEGCARLHWSDGARKVVVLTGDSPGASLMHPLPAGADLCVRRLDVDTQADALHRRGVEVVTIYHPPPASNGLHTVSPMRELLLATRTQYRRLASLPMWSFEAAEFDVEAAVARLDQVVTPIARGAALGEPVTVTR